MLSAVFLAVAVFPSSRYDPLKSAPDAVKTVDTVFKDSKRNRELPIRLYLPPSAGAAPVVLFSHGLGGSSKNNGFMGKHWAGRGNIAVFVQHPGSDESVWRDVPLAQRMKAMNAAANGKNTVLRFEDIKFVLDELEKRNKEGSLKGQFDLAHVGMSGHSFGAVTTQGVSGQWFPVVGTKYTDKRIRAATMFSPSTPKAGDPSKVFGSVAIPWLCITGTEDVAPIGGATVEDRLAVYPALPKGGKYELVLFGADHMAFGDSDLRLRGGGKRNPNHHKACLAITTAFWDANLRGDPDAQAWLNGSGPRSILEPKDSWKRK